MGETDEKILKGRVTEALAGHELPRRNFLKVSALGVGAAAAALAGLGLGTSAVGTALAHDEPDDDDDLLETIRVINAHITFTGGSPNLFVTIGSISRVDGEDASGTFYCRGVFTGSGFANLREGTPVGDTAFTFVDQRFLIAGRGQIYGSGDEGGDPLLVVGGTGDFEEVEGTYLGQGLPIPVSDGILNFIFDLDD